MLTLFPSIVLAATQCGTIKRGMSGAVKVLVLSLACVAGSQPLSYCQDLKGAHSVAGCCPLAPKTPPCWAGKTCTIAGEYDQLQREVHVAYSQQRRYELRLVDGSSVEPRNRAANPTFLLCRRPGQTTVKPVAANAIRGELETKPLDASGLTQYLQRGLTFGPACTTFTYTHGPPTPVANSMG
jgi:hypothetical protein